MSKKIKIPSEMVCKICSKIMYIPENTPMVIEPCKHIICERCILSESVTTCPVCNKNIMSFMPDEELPKKYHEIYANKPKPDPDDVCNFAKYSTNLIKQPTYRCITCNTDESQPICEKCAKICHAGHHLIELPPSLVSGCACGQNLLKRSCKCLTPNHLLPLCTNALDQGAVVQHGYSCRSCDLSFICNACAEKCHKGHIIDDAGVAAHICHCGMHKGNVQCRCMHKEDASKLAKVAPTMPLSK